MKLQRATNRIRMSFTFVLLLAGISGIAAGATPEATVAIKGYDTVAYFTAGKALKGTESFTYSWHGMTWFFQSGRTGTFSLQVRRNTLRGTTAGAPGP